MVRGPLSRPEPPDLRGGGDRHEMLLDVLRLHRAQRHGAREREARERARRDRESRVPRWLVLLLFLATAWVWLFPPPILRVAPPAPQSVAREEAALRFAIEVQARRIEAFRRDQGRLPAALGEVGPPQPGMEYVRLGPELYQLTGATRRVTLTYRSDLPLEAFAGGAADPEGETRR